MTDEVQLDTTFPQYVFVDGIPSVTEDKYAKLAKVLENFFKKQGGSIQSVFIPKTPEGGTKGICFIEYSSKDEAEAAASKLNNTKLDNAHTLRANLYDDIKRAREIPDKYEEPVIQPYTSRENLQSWLLDEREFDQYVMRYGEMTEVVWNDLKAGEDPESVIKRQAWSDVYVNWSPKGSYLLTIHVKGGVALWGGPNWNKFARFVHPGVKLVEFSPCERYLVTASPQFQEHDNPKDPQCIIVWDIRSGKKLRGFQSGGNHSWPVFKWSYDGNYIARTVENAVSVFCVPSMDLLDKKSIKAPGVKEISWSPTELLLSFFSPAQENRSPTLQILEIPSKKEKRSKTLFDAIECKLNWHPNGTYLALKIDRMKKKTTVQGFEIFRIRERDIPVELLDIKETVHSFSWEPRGNRFAIVCGEQPRFDISFYAVEKSIRLVKTLEKRNTNSLYWSPLGKNIVMAGVTSGVLEFFNADNMETMGTTEHYNVTALEWDPTGRYFTTTVSAWRTAIENGYRIFNFQGKELRNALKDKFYQFLWRPRPPTPLSEERIEKLANSLDSLSKKYKEADQQKKKEEREARKQKRILIRHEFEAYIQERRDAWNKSNADFVRDVLDGEEYDDQKNYYYVEDMVEEVQQVEESLEDN